jgi:hypothetical protein
MGTGIGGVTPGVDWTELYEQTTDNWHVAQTQFRTGSTSTSVDWSDICDTGAGPDSAQLFALEIRAASSSVDILWAQSLI